MINTYLATCDSCQQKFIFRAVVPLATTDSLRFSCPECESELWANLNLDYSVPKMDLTPQGFILGVPLQEYDLPIYQRGHWSLSHRQSIPMYLVYPLNL